jgi:hypothetical protein
VRELLAVAALLLTACGRIGFDTSPETGNSRDATLADATIADAYIAPSCTPSCAIDEYCGTPSGSCGAGGTCAMLPVTCSPLVDYVCGCNGLTYENDCVAARAGVSVATVGVCVPASGYMPNCSPPCTGNNYCYTDVGMCGQPGMCRPIPAAGSLPGCPDVNVCGCDGRNYGGCEATYAGMSIDYAGPCDEI